jgi:hypothetical protein
MTLRRQHYPWQPLADVGGRVHLVHELAALSLGAGAQAGDATRHLLARVVSERVTIHEFLRDRALARAGVVEDELEHDLQPSRPFRYRVKGMSRTGRGLRLTHERAPNQGRPDPES